MIFFSSPVPYEGLFDIRDRKVCEKRVPGGIVMLSSDSSGECVDGIFSTDLKMYLDPKLQPGMRIK